MRVINVEVVGYHVRKDAKVAGAMGEGNIAKLRITFGEDWAGFAKSVTFFNALGENPTVRTLTTDLLEDITARTNVYLIPIPPEAMTDAGMLTLVIDGYIDGVRQRSVEDTLEVKYSRSTEEAMESADPTPSQSEQLQGQIDAILGDIRSARESAQAAEAAAQKAQDAVGKTAYIGDNGNWYEWDSESGAFVDSGVAASGFVDENTGERVRMWFGTVAEYNALNTIEKDVLYHILEGRVVV